MSEMAMGWSLYYRWSSRVEIYRVEISCMCVEYSDDVANQSQLKIWWVMWNGYGYVKWLCEMASNVLSDEWKFDK